MELTEDVTEVEADYRLMPVSRCRSLRKRDSSERPEKIITVPSVSKKPQQQLKEPC